MVAVAVVEAEEEGVQTEEITVMVVVLVVEQVTV